MKDWKKLSYGDTQEPLMRQISYEEAQRIYNLFCERLSYTRTRSAPYRRKVSLEEKKRFMETIYGPQIARADDTGGEMFAGIPAEHVERFHEAKAWYERLRERTRSLLKTLPRDRWEQREVIDITTGCGAEIAGFVEYYDPVYKEDMVMLVFGIGMLDVNKMKVPSLEAETLFFSKNVRIQSMTNEIAEKLWDRGVYCEPVPCATYYHLDNIEFNQVRFCEGAFDGSVGKNFLFLSRDFGCKFRMGQVILYPSKGMKISRPETIDFCKGCTICVDACPSKALKVDDAIVCSRYFITHDHCSVCMDVCPVAKDA